MNEGKNYSCPLSAHSR